MYRKSAAGILKVRSVAPGQRSWRTYVSSVDTAPKSDAQIDISASSGVQEKKGGAGLDGFFSLHAPPLPQRFSDLKKALFTDQLVQSWREVLAELAVKTEEVAAKGADNIPQVHYSSIEKGLSKEQIKAVKDAGVVVVKGGVSQEEACSWKQSIRDYIQSNAGLVKGTPPDNVVFYELYNSKAQLAARTHPALLRTQHALCALWHASAPSAPVSLGTQLAYFDRLRMRAPGPSAFAVGCHVDGGGLERWEDAGFRACFARILAGRWREHDPYDAAPRVGARQDLYGATNQCTVFRPWQGWTALSPAGAREGTLRVLPFLRLSTAYIMLRPFFRLKAGAARRVGAAGAGAVPLGFDDWETNLDGPEFPGSEMGKAQLLDASTHPHLQLERTMTSIPRVEPGDQVYWHCDLTHAVESEHVGRSDSSVLYIPAVPLTLQNATYLKAQLDHFKKGLPAPDFCASGEDGEARFVGRATVQDVTTPEARRALGMEPFDVPPGSTPDVVRMVQAANEILQV